MSYYTQFTLTNDYGVTFWCVNAIYSVSIAKRRERIETVFVNIFYYASDRPLVPLFYHNSFGGLTVLVYDMETMNLLERKDFDPMGNEVSE